MDSTEARALAGTDPASFLRVTRPEINFPHTVDEHASEVYQRGKEELQRLVAERTLEPSKRPGLWVYEQSIAGHSQRGIVACVSVDEYDRDLIRKHEKTRRDKEDDRATHIETLAAHDEPVFLTFRADTALSTRIEATCAMPSEDDFLAEDGVRHRTWSIPLQEEAALVEAFAARVPLLYVADGHHRSAASSRVHARLRGTPGEHDRFLAVLFPHDTVRILPYNRLVRDARRRSAVVLEHELRQRFLVREIPRGQTPKTGTFAVFLGGRWLLLEARQERSRDGDPVAMLDVSRCQEELLAPVFGVGDPRTDRNLGFVGGIRPQAELEARVLSEQWSAAILLNATSMEQLLAVSDANEMMPPKSTWFEPKLRSGLFVHPFG